MTIMFIDKSLQRLPNIYGQQNNSPCDSTIKPIFERFN